MAYAMRDYLRQVGFPSILTLFIRHYEYSSTNGEPLRMIFFCQIHNGSKNLFKYCVGHRRMHGVAYEN